MEPINNDEIEIDLKELLYVLMKKLWLILLSGIVLATGTGIFSGLILTPVYTSTSKLYVVSKATSLTNLSDLQLGSQLTQDYMVLVNSRPVLDQVIENLNLDMNYEELLDKIVVNNPTNTRILEISVEDHDSYFAKELVDEVANVFAERMSKVMDVKEPNIVEEGNLPIEPTSPHVWKNTLIGGILGLLLAAAFVSVRYIMNDTIKTTEDIEKYLGMNILGFIPMEESLVPGRHKKKKKR